jgi:hypothetical protein
LEPANRNANPEMNISQESNVDIENLKTEIEYQKSQLIKSEEVKQSL